MIIRSLLNTFPRSISTQNAAMNGTTKRPTSGKGLLTWLAVAVLCATQGLAIWIGLEGRSGLKNGWPLWRHDHPLYYYSALVTRAFLKQSGTTAGYDLSFMAGYAKSVVFPASSTLPLPLNDLRRHPRNLLT
jgi:hypothetical protein